MKVTTTAEPRTKRTTGAAYVEIGGLTFYFDDSLPGETIIEWWETDPEGVHPLKKSLWSLVENLTKKGLKTFKILKENN